MSKTLQFGFPSLLAAQQSVIRQHPRASEPAGKPEPDRLTALIARVVSATASERVHLAASLTSNDATILVHAFERQLPKSHIDAVADVILHRPLPRQLSQAWLVLRNYPYLSELQAVMREVAVAIPEHTLASDATLKRLRALWAAKQLSLALVDDIESSTLDLPTWCSRSWPNALAVGDGFPLNCAVRTYLLAHGSRGLYLRHSLSMLTDWFATVLPHFKDLAASNYLNQLEPDEWDWSLVEAWVKEYGLPAIGGAFWAMVHRDRRDAIQRRIAGRLIAAFFQDVHDPQGRFRFWEGYIDSLTGISYPQNRERVLLKFHAFLLVEFRDTGNAGYIYKSDALGTIEPIVVSTRPLADCKIRKLVQHRILHQRGWQNRARSYLTRLIRR